MRIKKALLLQRCAEMIEGDDVLSLLSPLSVPTVTRTANCERQNSTACPMGGESAGINAAWQAKAPCDWFLGTLSFLVTLRRILLTMRLWVER